MRSIVLTAVYIGVLCSSMFFVKADEITHPVLTQINRINDAIREGDKALYAEIYSDDVLFTFSGNGKLYSLEQLTANVRPTADFTPVMDEVVLHEYGQTVVVNFRVRYTQDKPAKRVTMTFVEQAGTWRSVASHSTVISDSTETTTTSKNKSTD